MTNIIINDALGIGKLAEAVSSYMGRKIEPELIVRKAKAQSEAMSVLGNGIQSNPDLEIKYDRGELTISEKAELTQRYQSLKKEINLESVVKYAGNELINDPDISKEPLNDNWIMRFFDMASYISTDDMQMLWGKILAGEIKQPNSYSLRTLDVLRNLSKEEADYFKKLSSYILYSKGYLFILLDTDIISKHGFEYGKFYFCNEAGLISIKDVVLKLRIEDVGNYTEIKYGNFIIKITTIKKFTEPSTLGVYILTHAGYDLYKLTEKIYSRKYLDDVILNLKSTLRDNVQIELIDTNEAQYISK